MQLPILVEPTADGRFREEIGEPFRLFVVGHDAQHALDDLVRQVQQQLRSGARVAVLTLDNGSIQVTAPFPADDAYKADSIYQELTDEMAENRRLEDAVGP